MYTSNTSIRVRYTDTDQMGYVYYGCYASYYEVARVECLRQLGITYKEVEEAGTIMPVLECSSKFIKPAFYDDILLIVTTISTMPGIKIHFRYKIFRKPKELIHEGNTTLAFVKKNTRKPCLIPEFIQARLIPFFT